MFLNFRARNLGEILFTDELDVVADDLTNVFKKLHIGRLQNNSVTLQHFYKSLFESLPISKYGIESNMGRHSFISGKGFEYFYPLTTTGKKRIILATFENNNPLMQRVFYSAFTKNLLNNLIHIAETAGHPPDSLDVYDIIELLHYTDGETREVYVVPKEHGFVGDIKQSLTERHIDDVELKLNDFTLLPKNRMLNNFKFY